MTLHLTVVATHQKAGSILKVSVNGSYDPFWQAARASLANLSITLVRLAKITSSGPQYVSVPIEKNIPVGIERNGMLTRDGFPAGPLLFSKKVSSANMKGAKVIVDLVRNGQVIASEMVGLK